MKPEPNSKLSRRQALARLGLSPLALYAVPVLAALSSAAEAASGGSAASDPSIPTPPTPPSEPSGPQGEQEVDENENDHCRGPSATSTNGPPLISQNDNRRAQASVDAGYSKPLRQIWQGIVDVYPGQILSVKFTGHRYRPRYRLRAIAPNGRLETVVVSARTGAIERIVGC